jgi:hypothetical protein
MKRIEEGEVQWLKRDFSEEDLTMLGRSEVDGVVDAVFVTVGGKKSQSMAYDPVTPEDTNDNRHADIESLSPPPHSC